MFEFLSLFRAAPERPRWLSTRPGAIGPHPKGEMQWQASDWGFLGGRGVRIAARGKKSPIHRCGRTIEAKPVFGQTCLIEPALDRAFVARWKEFSHGGVGHTDCN